ncbi:MAG: DUF1987 domain-containing protein [Bacteroidetes bacterium]|nr:DUF1987 domain-containing protein [Bacteroidota bacterium]HET6243343.1 DUF1987 domain-containing protein [Bacteroidia bacterium]
MEPLIIPGTEICPDVRLDVLNNIFEIKGKSIPPDGKTFYEPILDWLKIYSYNPNQTTNFRFNLEFFNITSSKMLLFILYKLSDIHASGFNVNITWCYGDDDMFEVGEDYAYMINIPFDFIANPEKTDSAA